MCKFQKRLNISKEQLEKDYIEYNQISKLVAEKYNFSNTTILRKLKEFGIEKRKKSHRFTSKEVNCYSCNKKIIRKQCHIKKFKNSFCSAKCIGKWISKNKIGKNNHNYIEKIETKCNACGNKLFRSKRRLEKYKMSFCSLKCFGEWKSINHSGINSASYLGGEQSFYGPEWERAKRKNVREKKYCILCNRIESKKPDTHHIWPFRHFGLENSNKANHQNNLTSYCNKCHTFMEWNFTRLFHTKEFFDETKILETSPKIGDKFIDCYSHFM